MFATDVVQVELGLDLKTLGLHSKFRLLNACHLPRDALARQMLALKSIADNNKRFAEATTSY